MPQQVTFLLAYAEPTLGMERTALRVAGLLSARVPTSVVSVASDVPATAGVSTRSLGGRPRVARLVVQAWRVRRWLRGPDSRGIVVLVGAWIAIPALVLGGRRRNFIVWEHSMMEEKIANSRSLRLLSFLARLLYPRAARIVVVSDVLADDLRSALPSADITVIPNPVSMGSGERGSAVAGYVSVGSLTRTKRHELAVRAVARCPGATLVVYGEGPQREHLSRLIADLGVEDRVKLEGYVDHDSVILAIRGAEALIHPSVGETFGLAYLEAAAEGTYVLAANNRVSRWLIPEYVPGATFDDLDELVALLSEPRELNDKAQSDSRDRRARKFAEEAIRDAWVALARDHPVGGEAP